MLLFKCIGVMKQDGLISWFQIVGFKMNSFVGFK
jgi:hypothetical protein